MPDWWACKTMIHQIAKRLPKNRKLAPVIAEFEKEEEDIPEGEFEVVEESTAAAGPSPQSAAGASETPGKGQQETATTAAAAAPLVDDTPSLEEEPDPATLTLDQAKALLLIGTPGAWGGRAGQPLDSLSKLALGTVRQWCIGRIETDGDDPAKLLTVHAIDLILKSRSAQPAAAR